MVESATDETGGIGLMQEEKTPKVSVCVVTYNQEKYIRQCLQSIVDQETDFDFEVIVSDDCSTDGTRAIVQEFAKRYPVVVKPIFHEKNVGAFKNYVLTHNAASGWYVSHCDGDDYFLSNKLQKQADYLDANEGCSITYTRSKIFNDKGESWESANGLPQIFPENKFNACDLLSLGSIGIHSTQMYRRCSRKTMQPDFLTLDYFYAIEYLLAGYGYYFDEVLSAYRYNKNAGTLSTSSANQNKNKKLIAKYQLYYAKKAPHLKKCILIGALTFLMIDIKNLRLSALFFARNILYLLGPISLKDLYRNLQYVHVFRTRRP